VSSIQRFWRANSAVAHIIIWTFAAGIAWAGVASQGERIDKLEVQYEQIIEMREDISQIKEAVGWLKDRSK
jgi:hypothetical protein